MREQIGLLSIYNDCKNSNRDDFSKFNNSEEIFVFYHAIILNKIRLKLLIS